jgi:hypothetical protein
MVVIIGGCTCWNMVDTFHGLYLMEHYMVLMYMVDVHGCCAWWAHILVQDILG